MKQTNNLIYKVKLPLLQSLSVKLYNARTKRLFHPEL